MGRAVAAAVLGDAEKLKFVPLASKQKVVAVSSGQVDITSRTTTWTMKRDAKQGVDFTTIVFYDGQGFMVPKKSGVTSAKQLSGATVCVTAGTTTELNLADFARANNLKIEALVFDGKKEAFSAYTSGRCDAFTTDVSQLASLRTTVADPQDHEILPEVISKEPLAPLVRHGDNQWKDIVTWVINGLIEAEEYGITQANVLEMKQNSKNPAVQRILGATGDVGTFLDLDNDWLLRAIQAVGNYGEIYDRHFGPNSASEHSPRVEQALDKRRSALRACRFDDGRLMSFLRNNRVAGVLLQMAFTGVVIWMGYLLFSNTQANLEARNIASGFDFLSVEAGFPISNSLIAYSPAKSYGYALVVGILNTLYVAVLGIVAASVIGVLIGVARVSRNWLVSRLATAYVEILRNIPLLLILFFTYGVVLSSLPSPRASLNPFWGCFLNNRGLYLPRPVFQSGFAIVALCGVLGVVAAVLFARWAFRHRVRTGRVLPSGWIGGAMVVGFPAAAFVLCGGPAGLGKGRAEGVQLSGGVVLRPEFTALMLGLVLYTAAFIGENVRSGIQSVGRGQIEAAHSLGVNRATVMRRVVLPQALRVILPATTNDYTSLVKNSSLAVAIGYPDMVSVGGTIIGQNDQAIEIIGLWMAVYLAINLIVSVLMNWVNAKVQIVER